MIEKGKAKAHIQYSEIEKLWYTSMIGQGNALAYIDQRNTMVYIFMIDEGNTKTFVHHRSRKH